MHYLKKIADAKTKEDYEDAVEELRDLPLYDEKENVQNAHVHASRGKDHTILANTSTLCSIIMKSGLSRVYPLQTETAHSSH